MPNYDLNTIGAYTKYVKGIRVDREIAGIADGALFLVVNGPVQLNLLYGIVTNTVGAAIHFHMDYVADLATGNFAMNVESADFTTDAIGTVYILPATAAGAITTDGGGGLQLFRNPFILQPGHIWLDADATVTGTIKWSLFYVPLIEGAYVEAHA